MLLLEVSANLYGTWGTSWKDCLQMDQHLSCLRFFLWILSRAISSNVSYFFETVMDRHGAPHSHRMWLPLTPENRDQFVTECAGAMPLWREAKAAKIQKIKRPVSAGSNLELKRDVLAALRVYLGGEALSDLSAAPVIAGETPSNHILHLLSAQREMSRKQQQYERAGVPSKFRYLDSYVCTPDNGRGHSLVFTDTTNVRAHTELALETGDDLLQYMLPHRTATEAQKEAARQAVAHATDGSAPVSNVSFFADLKDEDPTDDEALAGLLRQIYPVMERVRTANKDRLRETGLPGLRKIAAELDTLLSLKVAGVPTVYAAGRSELKIRMDQLRAKVMDPAMSFAKRLFFQPVKKDFTYFGSMLGLVISGVCGAARLMPAQQRLYLLLWLRSHKIAANHLGSQGFIVCCGPPETGKSKACQDWLRSLPSFLVQVKDVVSAKSYTAMDEDADLRACFRDEMHELATKGARDDPNTRAQQTLSSNGILQIERLVRDEATGEYRLVKTPKAGRTLTVTCTNNLHDVPPAIISRALVVAVPACKVKDKGKDSGTLASIGNTVASALHDGFIKFSQILVAMQVDFWAADAAGLIEIDDRMILVYRLIAETLGGPSLSARKMNEVRHTATSAMVLELCSRWYCTPLGAESGFDRAKQLEFFALNSYLKMEHVLAAVSVASMTTSVDTEMMAIRLTLRAMLKIDHCRNVFPYAGDSQYFEINTTRRRIYDDVADRNPELGAGLAKTLLRSISKGTTHGKQNIRYVVDDLNHEKTLVYGAFLGDSQDTAERLMLAHMREAPKALSWDGHYYVFRSRQRQRYTFDDETDGIRKELCEIGREEFQVALTMLRARKVSVGGRLQQTWRELDRIDVRRPAFDSPLAIEIDGEMFVKKTELQALAVHKSLLDLPESGTSKHRELFSACLAVAGGYGTKQVTVGIGPSHKGAATVVAASEARVRVPNPLHTPDQIAELLGPDSGPKDTIFPPSKPFVVWSQESELERQCREDLRSILQPCATSPQSTSCASAPPFSRPS